MEIAAFLGFIFGIIALSLVLKNSSKKDHYQARIFASSLSVVCWMIVAGALIVEAML